jgi:hypothetical protein
MLLLRPFLRGEGWGEGLLPKNRPYIQVHALPLTRIALDDANASPGAIRPLPVRGRGQVRVKSKEIHP